MTDFAGTEEPAGTDDEALDSMTPIIGVPAAAGVAAPAVIIGSGTVDAETSKGERETDDDDHEVGIT